jgi:hypothetical protein
VEPAKVTVWVAPDAEHGESATLELTEK